MNEFMSWLRSQPTGGGIRFYEYAKARFVRQVPDVSSEQYQRVMAEIAKHADV